MIQDVSSRASVAIGSDLKNPKVVIHAINKMTMLSSMYA